MKKVNLQQAQRKMDKKIKGGISLWDRITNDPKFIQRKREIRAHYGLPLKYDIRLHPVEWMKWMGFDGKPAGKTAKRGQSFLSELYALFKKFEVPDAWHNDLIAEIAGTSSDQSADMQGSPKFEIYKDAEGNLKWQCIITPETDLTNPMYLEMIQNQQKQYAGDPPKPIRDRTDPRKMDWRPVYEWHKSHPLFTLEEVAKKIGYPPHRVRLKLAELEPKE